MSLDQKKILVTGATGSFGKRFIQTITKHYPNASVRAFSRDELKQFELQQENMGANVTFFLGDVRDFQRVVQVTKDIDVVIHAAAMKQIPAAEKNPMEAIKTNILGAENIVNAALENGVKKVVALSTDKAANPANLYGATKLCSDKLMIAGNYLRENSQSKFSIVRYGNVLGSRGSVVPFFLEMAKEGYIPITDIKMTRFWLTLDQAVDLVLTALEEMQGGEIFVPKIPSFKVIDVANVLAPGVPIKIIGVRPGEKLHEIMITEDDAFYTREFENHYRILSPQIMNSKSNLKIGKKVEALFSYRSDTNPIWHDMDSFREVLVKNALI